MAKLTVDELAQASGLNTSTIRLYRHRGLLPAPTMEGRTGYFDDGHLARLRLIAELRARGFSLAAIKDLVDSWESGRDLQTVLGMERALARPADTQPMTRAEFAARFPDVERDPALWDRLFEIGVMTRRDDDLDIATGFLTVATGLSALGVSLGEMLDEFAPVQEFARETAQRFVALFERHVLGSVADVDPAALTLVVEQLRAAGIEVVSAALGIAIDDAAAAAVARLAPRTLN